MEKKIINMDELFDDSCAKSIAESLMVMYNTGVYHVDEMVISFIKRYLPEQAEYFVDILDGIKSNHYMCTSARINEERCTIHANFKRGCYNAGIYNLCGLLIQIDENINIDDTFLLNKSYGNEEKAIYNAIDKLESIVMIIHGTAEFSMDMNYQLFGALKDCFHNVSTNSISRLKNIRAFQVVKDGLEDINQVDDDRCYVFEINQLIDIIRIRKQFVLQKLLIALHFLRCSPEYGEVYKCYSYNLISILSSILYCGEIYKIYLQAGYFDDKVEVSSRGSQDFTTRMSIIMSIENEDIFILRIDLPHKGEDKIHLNMEELVDDKILPVGLPFVYQDQKEIMDMLSNDEKERLFYCIHNQYWFRTQAERNIKKIGLDKEKQEAVAKLFYLQSHKSISVNLSHENDFYIFMDELKKYITRFGVDEGNLLCFAKGTIDYKKEVLKIRKLHSIYGNVSRMIISDSKQNRYSTISFSGLGKMFAEIVAENDENYSANSIIDVWEIMLKI